MSPSPVSSTSEEGKAARRIGLIGSRAPYLDDTAESKTDPKTTLSSGLYAKSRKFWDRF